MSSLEGHRRLPICRLAFLKSEFVATYVEMIIDIYVEVSGMQTEDKLAEAVWRVVNDRWSRCEPLQVLTLWCGLPSRGEP